MLSLQRLLTKLRSQEAKVATTVAATDPAERYRAAVMDAAAGRELDPDKVAYLLAELERTADDFAADVEGAVESSRDRDAIASLEATRRKRADVQSKIEAAIERGNEFARQVAKECESLITDRDKIDAEIQRVEFLRSTKLKNPPPELATEQQAARDEIARIEKRISYIADPARKLAHMRAFRPIAAGVRQLPRPGGRRTARRSRTSGPRSPTTGSSSSWGET